MMRRRKRRKKDSVDLTGSSAVVWVEGYEAVSAL